MYQQNNIFVNQPNIKCEVSYQNSYTELSSPEMCFKSQNYANFSNLTQASTRSAFKDIRDCQYMNNNNNLVQQQISLNQINYSNSKDLEFNYKNELLSQSVYDQNDSNQTIVSPVKQQDNNQNNEQQQSVLILQNGISNKNKNMEYVQCLSKYYENKNQYQLCKMEIESEEIKQQEQQQYKKIKLNSIDKNNNWIVPFLKNRLIKKIFEQDGKPMDKFGDLFHLKQDESLNIKLKFPSKLEFERKKQLLHQKKRSKFHNKNKLFFNCIVKLFKKKVLEKLEMNDNLYQKFISLVTACRISGRKIENNKVKKTDLFNHSHYNLILLTLNDASMSELAKNEQDYLLHLKTFGIDIREKKIKMFQESEKDIGDEVNINTLEFRKIKKCLFLSEQEFKENDISFQEYVDYINFLKICVYQVIVLHLKDQMLGSSEQQVEEREYDCRAFQCIYDMIQGNFKERF